MKRDLNIFCFAKNLLKTQIKASASIGDAIKIIIIELFYPPILNNIHTNNEPKNVLPLSPKNILAGLQFQ